MPVRKLQKAMSTLRALDPDIAMSVVVAFLSLADGEEVEVRVLERKLDLSMSALNRALTYLGENHWRKASKKTGLGLVNQRVSPEDRRVRIASLSAKGRRVIQSLEEDLDDVLEDDQTTERNNLKGLQVPGLHHG